MKNEFKKIFDLIIPYDTRPIIVYSAIWPFTIAMKRNADDISQMILEALLERISLKQSVFMPTFTEGYKNGICDLDNEPSKTGYLTECFRKTKGVSRTLSAFFSFAVAGPDMAEVTELRAIEAWGKGSLYEWLHIKNAHIVTIGTHPTHCSFTHRAEWLAKDIIKYRIEKAFKGTIVKGGNCISLEENLFVRKGDPAAINDWTWLLETYLKNGMKVYDFNGISISSMDAKKKMDLIIPILQKDSLALVKNREAFENE